MTCNHQCCVCGKELVKHSFCSDSCRVNHHRGVTKRNKDVTKRNESDTERNENGAKSDTKRIKSDESVTERITPVTKRNKLVTSGITKEPRTPRTYQGEKPFDFCKKHDGFMYRCKCV